MTTPRHSTTSGAEFATGTTPSPVTGHLNPSPSGLDYAGIQRLAGSYTPGSMGRLSDESDGGSDDYSSGEE
jgi:hypothetical protein